MLKSKYLILFVVIVFASCERIENLNTEIPFKSKLVVSGFVAESDNEVSLLVTKTTPIVGTETALEATYVKDAIVTVQIDDKSLTLLYDSMEKNYSASLNGDVIMENQQVHIKVQGNNETVTATSIIPARAVTNLTAHFDSVFQNGSYAYICNLTCGIVDATTRYVYLYPFIVYADSSRLPMTSFELQRIRKVENGATFSQKFNGLFYSNQIPAVRLEVVTMFCDQPYAEYFNQSNTFSYASLGSPFGEPIVVKSKLSNGIGVLGSYTTNGIDVFPLK